MNSIKISLQEVQNCQKQIESLNERIYTLLTDMKNQMNSLNASWISDSANTIRTRFNQFANRFDVQKETINAYAKFLELTVSSYDNLETTINANASSANT
ncbi:MAG: pore-forming ESAT-6 family protein [Erysipelotrichaceae bacterium]|nr:pore-forming ESAT-6 family protein [Erysipelotrichaceae bacterium]MDY5251332.1 pore-forming ESAT-6 family protein [Erysipelotrichaceae bacterium]